MKINTITNKGIEAGLYIIAGSDTSLRFAHSEKEAEDIIKAFISDIVYEELGGDEAFLYDEEGNVLPDEQIVDKVDDILELGEQEYLCYKDEVGLWAYAGDEDGNGRLWFSVYKA